LYLNRHREEASVEGDVAGGFVGRAVVETVDDVRGGGDQRALLVGERRVPFVRIVLIVRVVVITRSVLVVVTPESSFPALRFWTASATFWTSPSVTPGRCGAWIACTSPPSCRTRACSSPRNGSLGSNASQPSEL
jgi:hypothetical protein